jgi:hypothetical protein
LKCGQNSVMAKVRRRHAVASCCMRNRLSFSAWRTASRVLVDVVRFVSFSVRSRSQMAAGNLFLRNQLALYAEGRATLVPLERLIDWRAMLTIVTPDTVIRWHSEIARGLGGCRLASTVQREVLRGDRLPPESHRVRGRSVGRGRYVANRGRAAPQSASFVRPAGRRPNDLPISCRKVSLSGRMSVGAEAHSLTSSRSNTAPAASSICRGFDCCALVKAPRS